MDVVQKDQLQTYLDNYGFDENEEDVLEQEVTRLSRNENKKLKFTFR